MKIGLIIQKLRNESNMTQEELAERLFVTQQLVSGWENNQYRPDYPTVCKIAELFGVEPNYIFDTNNAVLDELASCFSTKSDLGNMNSEKRLNSFLKKLSESDRRIFIHRYYYFEATKEIAKIMGIKDGTVRSSLSRTREKLQKFLLEEYFDEQ